MFFKRPFMQILFGILIIGATSSANAQVAAMSDGNVKWEAVVASMGGWLPPDAVIGGSEYNGSRKLAVCRAAYQGGTHPGKVVAGKCNIGWGGKEIVLNAFEVLVQR